jgi:hypothetical protein
MESWQPVSKLKFIAFSAGVVIIALMILTSGSVFILDGANLLFHEAGHMFFGIFGPAMELYGGTLGQFVFPLVLIVSFWRQGLTVSFAAGWIWFFENFFSVANYMADARAQELPLVGGGEHDWFNIFIRWHVLEHDTTIAAVVYICGWAGMALTWGWLAWKTFFGREREKKDHGMAPDNDERS